MKVLIVFLFVAAVAVVAASAATTTATATATATETSVELTSTENEPAPPENPFTQMCLELSTPKENVCEQLKNLVATLPPCDAKLKELIAYRFEKVAQYATDLLCYEDKNAKPFMTREDALAALGGMLLSYRAGMMPQHRS